MKYTYRLILNEKISQAEQFCFRYGSTKNIQLRVGEKKAEIIAILTKDYADTFEGSYAEALFKEAIRKANLLHILRYGESLKTESIQLEIPGNMSEKKILDLTADFPLCSMVSGKLTLPESLKEPSCLKKIISVMKKDAESQIASLYAYLYSKCKTYEVEKFMYLWMSFNGFYKSKYKLENDKDGITEAVKEYGFGSEISNNKTRNSIGKKVMVHLEDYEQIVSLIENNQSLGISDYLINKDGTPLDISEVGYLTTDFAYYLRCNLFHANKPLLLFAFINDYELNAIRIVNKLLDHFMDEHISELFLNDSEE